MRCIQDYTTNERIQDNARREQSWHRWLTTLGGNLGLVYERAKISYPNLRKPYNAPERSVVIGFRIRTLTATLTFTHGGGAWGDWERGEGCGEGD